MAKLEPYDASWHNLKKMLIADNVIYFITGKSTYEEYNPVHFYNQPIPQELVNYILGDGLYEQQDIFIHNLFLSLDETNYEQITRWIEHFGLLFPPGFDRSGNNISDHLLNSLAIGESKTTFDENKYLNDNIHPIGFLCEFAEEIRIFKKLATAIQILKNDYWNLKEFVFECSKDTNFLEFLCSENFFLLFENKKDKYFMRPASEVLNEIYQSYDNDLLDKMIESLFSYKLHKIIPKIKITDGNARLEITNTSLLGLLYYFLALDVSDPFAPRKCAAKGCSRHFTPTREGTLYCSDTCKNRAKQQRHRDKLKIKREGE